MRPQEEGLEQGGVGAIAVDTPGLLRKIVKIVFNEKEDNLVGLKGEALDA